MSASDTATRLLDMRGVRCPVPVVRLNTAMRSVPVGAVVEFAADDEAFPPDVIAWAERTGHELLRLETQDGVHRGAVRRAR